MLVGFDTLPYRVCFRQVTEEGCSLAAHPSERTGEGK